MSVLVGPMLDVSEDFFLRPRYDTKLRVTLKEFKVLHSKGLARSGLAIGKDRSVVTFEN